MPPRLFSNRITALFNIQHPILLGGMHLLGRSGVVAAVVNAGGMGFITPRSFENLAAYRADLQRCRDLTEGKPFGVNLTLSRRMGFNQDAPAWIAIALEEGVRHFESAGMAPDAIVAPIHAGGGVLLHKCPSVRHALHAQHVGADAVALVGLEEGGHPGANPLPTFSVPVALGGGIGCGRQIAAAMALGAEGVVMGTRFMVASEIDMHPAVKRHIVNLTEHDSITILSTLNDTWRVMANATARQVQALKAAGVRKHADFGDLILSARTYERVYRDGQIDAGIVSLSPAVGFANRVEPVGAIFAQLITETQAAIGALSRC